ncbi:MAG: 3-deoxy-7-phosphoheptulonate synthase, partial [Clostridia bacterium]|nr:3-deoxy-7-phosphoheptulonate synthase [Clostridia bacterium]
GYKGMLHQPDPFARPDLYRGIIALRELHMTALREYGFTCADEMLYPENHRYLSDLLGYVAVGARSVENQQHRLTASGLNIPVGMKNPTGGDINVMLNAISTAQHGHTFLYRGWEVESTGNVYAHAILRGFVDHSGACVPNYGRDTVELLASLYEARGLKNPAVIIDANHDNSGRDFSGQPAIAREVLAYRNSDSALKKLVKGLMIESYLEDGRQEIGERVFGRSITDPCLGWDKTERLIYEIAEKA